MTHAEFTRRIEEVCRAADAAIDETDARIERVRKVLNAQQHKVYQRRERAKRERRPIPKEKLEREADLIEAVIEAVRKVL